MKTKFALLFMTIVSSFFWQSCKQTDINQPCNDISENLINATAWFQQSAEMTACYRQAFNQAQNAVLSGLQNSNDDKPKAVIVDVDETMLDNSPFEVYLIQNNLDYSKDLWYEWVKMAIAEPLPGALEFAKFCQDTNVQVFYVSNRSVKNLTPTMQNLQAKGFPYADSTHILLKDTTSDKTPRRNIVLQNYDVLVYIGDNLRDFDEIFKDRNSNFGKDAVNENANLFGTKYIILPNPMYGQWMKAYPKPEEHSYKAKIKNIIQKLKGY